MVLGVLRGLQSWFRPAIEALTILNLPWEYRWRLLAFQPLTLIAYSIISLPWAFSRPWKVEWLKIAPGRTLRVLVFDDPSQRPANQGRFRPLHLYIHQGAFIGGVPEDGALFCVKLAKETGAVVISTSYRYAPAHHFPAAIDDIDVVVKYIQMHARERWGADPELMTTSGASAGGNLALALSQQPSCHPPAKTAIKGTVTFYGAIDLRLPPQDKPKPATLPKKDPFQFLLPLYDSYAAPVRAENMENPRMSPAIASANTLPANMLLVVAGIDILVHENLTFVERIKGEIARDPKHAGRRVEALYIENAFHGYLSLPASVTSQALKDMAFNGGIDFIKDVHRKFGWSDN
ncbi:putative lipase/esterase family protein [Pseudomassariella vexata]|uniref:Putative lipase/esterase family protein n=1 Tax=Pseudomassariella vexata TaxID=1141098 RepID=A0A1Y2DA65_9PEZI|nr:putative lipase/esterase family protein [Pseudomassariella vexata]ORY56168.1 putative lipase/esterase family protein [Pseudomassariella vexata]